MAEGVCDCPDCIPDYVFVPRPDAFEAAKFIGNSIKPTSAKLECDDDVCRCDELCRCEDLPKVTYHHSIADQMRNHNTLAEMIASNLKQERITSVEEGVRRLIIARQLNHDN
jgi:hypothetical protein